MKSGKGKDRNNGMSEHDLLRLSALGDDELNAKEREILAQQLGAESIAASQADLAFIGDGIRDFVDQRCRDERGVAREVSLWDAIAPDLESAPSQGIGEWLERLGAQVQVGLEVLLRPPVFAGMAVAMLAIVFVGVEFSPAPEGEALQIARVAQPSPSTVTATQETVPPVSFVGLGAAGTDVVALRQSVQPQMRFPQRRLARRAGALHTLSGGLRVGGADIEWIKAVSSVEIVPALNHHKPPVIWVGNRVR